MSIEPCGAHSRGTLVQARALRLLLGKTTVSSGFAICASRVISFSRSSERGKPNCHATRKPIGDHAVNARHAPDGSEAPALVLIRVRRHADRVASANADALLRQILLCLDLAQAGGRWLRPEELQWSQF